MKLLFTLILSLFVSTFVFAQLNAVMVNDSSYVWGDAEIEDLVQYDVFLNNMGTSTMDLRWVRTESLPAGWQSLICDAESCKGAEDDSFNYTQPVGQGLLIAHFIPNGLTGEGAVSLKVKSTENGDFIYATYYCKVSTVGIKEMSVSTELKVFPNPVQSDIKFANIQNYDVNSIEIYDLLGQRVMSFAGKKTQSSYNVDELRTGMYFVRLVDKNKTPLITKKFNKR